MAKILVSFIGTGRINSKNESGREYQTATYSFNGEERKSPFIASVLGEFLQVDDYYLFGTMKSMWEAVYSHFCTQKQIEIDENYSFELYEKCESANYTTNLDNDFFKKMETVLGKKSKVLPIHYGLNNEEIKLNFEIFAKAFSHLQDGDVIYLDITHSFRSLPLFATTALSFIQDVSDKKVSLGGIYYGMLDASREFDNKVPIIDISYISELQSWIKGAYAFSNFGNGFLISDLLKDTNKTASEKIAEFSKVLSMNYLHEVKTQVSILTNLANNDYSGPEKLVLPRVFKEFTKRFTKLTKLSEYQFELSKWHFDKKNYSLSYLCLIEAIITFVCEKENKDTKNEIMRNEVKGSILNNSEYSTIKEIYVTANKSRKSAAHVIEDTKEKSKKAVSDLNTFQQSFSKMLKK